MEEPSSASPSPRSLLATLELSRLLCWCGDPQSVVGYPQAFGPLNRLLTTAGCTLIPPPPPDCHWSHCLSRLWTRAVSDGEQNYAEPGGWPVIDGREFLSQAHAGDHSHQTTSD